MEAVELSETARDARKVKQAEVVFVDGPRSPGRQAERSAPVREVLFETETPEKPRRPVPPPLSVWPLFGGLAEIFHPP